MRSKKKHLLDRDILLPAALDAFLRINPLRLYQNPVMFVTFLGAFATTASVISDYLNGAVSAFNFQIMLWLWFTLLFANFAEAIAESREKRRLLP